ncbi:MAG: DUF262 domain-containing protein [Anaerolineaceae bacterium]
MENIEAYEMITTFSSDKESLLEILKTISKGGYQLPEFQRGWIWDDDHILSLLASVSLSYPIGALMMLENGNPQVKFKARPVEGVELNQFIEPERFILDGQQRLTSLFQTLMLNQVVKTRDFRKKEIKHWYYIDINCALNPTIDRQDAILSITEDKKIRNFRNEVLKDFSTSELEYEEMVFPISKMFNTSDWRIGFYRHWNYSQEKIELFNEFDTKVIKRFEQYLVPVIKLLRGTPKVAVCQIFEKVNTGGVPLSVFELVTASFAAEGYNLREDWEGQLDNQGRKTSSGRKDKIHLQRVLRSVGADELLQVISLLNTFNKKKHNAQVAVSCKRADILKLELSDYKAYVDDATEGFAKAAKFLFQQNIFIDRDLPYTTQIVPLAAILALLPAHEDTDVANSKIAKWYWCGVFGELYGGAIETRFAKDLVDVLNWIKSGPEPTTVIDSNFVPGRLDTLRSRNSAAYKGVFNLLLRDQCLDFRTGVPVHVSTFFENQLDIHHIFPKAWCEKANIDKKKYDSIINKTALSYQTNRIIGGNAPSIYLHKLRETGNVTVDRQNEILISHAIDVNKIRIDDFEGFFKSRREALLERIEKATGKPIIRQEQLIENDELDDLELELDDDQLTVSLN